MDPPSQDTPGKWISVYGGDLFPVVLQLLKCPNLGLIEGGKDGEDLCPLYVARGASSNSCYPGECGSHFSGARIPGDGAKYFVTKRFEVLIGDPADYQWRLIEGPFETSKINSTRPVLGGRRYTEGEVIEPLYIAKATTEDGGIHFGNVAEGKCASIYCQERVLEMKRFEVLVHADSNVHGAKVLTGRYKVQNDPARTREAARYSTAVNFEQLLFNVPRVAVGLSMIDIGTTKSCCIRVGSSASSIRRDGFTCDAESWTDGILHYAAVDWITIVDEPTWQTGLFKSSSFKKWGSENRVMFDKPFPDGPPILFACLSSIEMAGKWAVRMYTTNIDHTGFTVGIVNGGEEDGTLGNLRSAAVTWIAIPGSEVTKKRNVWMGSFAGDTGSKFHLDKDAAGGWNGWKGHVEFGFEFRRAPKIFVGLRQFCGVNDKNFRLQAKTSSVTSSGMDWKLEKWGDTKLLSAGANFLAIDADTLGRPGFEAASSLIGPPER